jgi:hypothetical protein
LDTLLICSHRYFLFSKLKVTGYLAICTMNVCYIFLFEF